MDVEINWLAVMLAGLSSMIVGSIWYAKPVFGTLWAKLAKLDEKTMAKGAGRAIAIAVVMSLLMAYILAHVSALSRAYFEVSTLAASLQTAFWLWLGISLTTVVVHDVFEKRPLRLTFLTVGNQFFTMMLMGLIIGLLGGF